MNLNKQVSGMKVRSDATGRNAKNSYPWKVAFLYQLKGSEW